MCVNKYEFIMMVALVFAGLLLLGEEAHSHFFDTDDQAKAYLRGVIDG